MKKVSLLIVFCLATILSFSQVIVNRSSSVVTVNDANLFTSGSFRPPIFSDTTSANLVVSLDSTGKVIFTRDYMGLWVRVCCPKRWMQIIPGGEVTADTLMWSVRGNNVTGLITQPFLGTTSNNPMRIVTNNVLRLRIPESGIVRDYNDPVNRFLLYDTVTKNMAYSEGVPIYALQPVNILDSSDGNPYIRVDTTDATYGLATQYDLTQVGGSGWELTGNAGTTAGTNFIGTTDDVDVVFKRNSLEFGRVTDPNTSQNTFFGIAAGNANPDIALTMIGFNAGSNSSGVAGTMVGNGAGGNSSGANVTFLGAAAGTGNTFDEVVAIGTSPATDSAVQVVFKVGSYNARYDFSALSADRKYRLPNVSGRLPMTVNGVGADANGDITISAGGVTTMANIGSSPNADGASISGSTLTLQPADGTYGGVVTTSAQSFAGFKTFDDGIGEYTEDNIDLSGGDFTVTKPGIYVVLTADLANGLIMPDPALFNGSTVTVINGNGADPVLFLGSYPPQDAAASGITVPIQTSITFKAMLFLGTPAWVATASYP